MEKGPTRLGMDLSQLSFGTPIINQGGCAKQNPGLEDLDRCNII